MSSSLEMLYSTLLSLTAFMFCLSLFLVYRASVLENDFRKLQGDIIRQLNQPRSEGFSDGRMAKMSKAREDIKQSAFQQTQRGSLKLSFGRVKREQGSCRDPQSFLQLSANANKRPYFRGNETVIPWTVALQRGHSISLRENKIVVQEDGYYMVFGQVLFESSDGPMGHVVRRGSGASEKTSTKLLRCVKVMPQKTYASNCYTSGVVKLDQEDELELVIPDRFQDISNQICMDADSTFFGVMQLN